MVLLSHALLFALVISISMASVVNVLYISIIRDSWDRGWDVSMWVLNRANKEYPDLSQVVDVDANQDFDIAHDNSQRLPMGCQTYSDVLLERSMWLVN